jgi:ATP-dependent RNA helicase DeaD
MLRMGFLDDVEKILSQASKERQVALFSATMPTEIKRISERYLNNPVHIQIERRTMAAPAIEQRFINVSEAQKFDVLTQILELEPSEAVLIFRRTKNGAAELAEKLEARGFAAEAMHGDMTQVNRESVVRRLRSGQVEIVVATDVAARGLDVEQIAHVVNYDIPYDVEAYVHRIGRTGRAGRTGVATLFITPRERRMMREIEKFAGAPIKPMKMPTHADVAAKRIELFKDKLRKELADSDLDMYVQLVEQIVDEGEHDATEVAAAAARLANGSRSLVADVQSAREEERPAAPVRETRSERPPARPSASRPPQGDRPAYVSARAMHEGAARSAETSRSDEEPRRAPRSDSGEAKVNLSIGVGKRDGIRPADIVGSIANEADVPGREIGPIDIREEVTIVGIPERYRDQVLEKTARAKFRGRPLNVRVASASEGAPRPMARTARPFAPRGETTERQRRERPYPRREGEAPRDRVVRAYQRDEAPRERAARPFKRDDAPRTAARTERPYKSARPASASRGDRPTGGFRTERPASGGYGKKAFGAGSGEREKRTFGGPKRDFTPRGTARAEAGGRSEGPKKFFGDFAPRGAKGARDTRPTGKPPFKKKPR